MSEKLPYGTEVNVFEMKRATLHELSGVVNVASVSSLFEYAHQGIDENRIHIVIDMSRVQTITVAGLNELRKLKLRATQAGGDVRLVAPSKSVREALTASGLDYVIDVYATQVEGVGSY